MEELKFIKTGNLMFDTLAGYGLAVILAYISAVDTVKFEDKGTFFSVQNSIKELPIADVGLSDILCIPSFDELKSIENLPDNISLSLANLDGLLAVLFTVPGKRVVSISDLIRLQKQHKSIADQCLKKVHAALSRWQRYIDEISPNASTWYLDAFQEYDSGTLNKPVIDAKIKNSFDISILMTIDPSFSYSVYRPASDTVIADKTNFTVRCPRYAVLFAMIGAARFLRAQRVAGSMINFYVPIFSSVLITSKTAMAVLPRFRYSSNRAAIYGCLSLTDSLITTESKTRLAGVAYQTLQTQKVSQSISTIKEYLDNGWIERVGQTGRGMLRYWQKLLNTSPNRMSFEINNLVDFLEQRDAFTLQKHLLDVAIAFHSYSAGKNIRCYKLDEVKQLMNESNNSNPALAEILTREHGTIRFGRALRQLADHNKAAVIEVIDQLRRVETVEQLLMILAEATQEMVMAKTDSNFIIVPDDAKDLKYLLQDVEKYGVSKVVSVLVILSSLSYPRVAVDGDRKSESAHASEDVEKTKNIEEIKGDNND